jgi:hypothetical protein
LATKAELISFLEENYVLEELEEDLYSGVFTVGGDRSQIVFLDLDSDKITISSPFAEEGSISAKTALILAKDYPIGIRIGYGHYTVVYLLPIQDLDTSEIEAGLGYVANYADQIEQAISDEDKH